MRVDDPIVAGCWWLSALTRHDGNHPLHAHGVPDGWLRAYYPRLNPELEVDRDGPSPSLV